MEKEFWNQLFENILRNKVIIQHLKCLSWFTNGVVILFDLGNPSKDTKLIMCA